MSGSETPSAGGDVGTSTLASGPAGTHFEGQIGAFYLLAMLSGAPPRGLPGTTIDKVALQQANAGRPLDDVIVHAHDNASGKAAVLEIQVKRSITFAAADPVFRKVVGQIVKASQRPDFLTQRYDLTKDRIGGGKRDGPLDLDLQDDHLAGSVVVRVDDHVVQGAASIGLLQGDLIDRGARKTPRRSPAEHGEQIERTDLPLEMSTCRPTGQCACPDIAAG